MLISNLRLACAAVTIAALPMAVGLAQEPRDQRTFFTFSQPVELPGGTTLQAGTYLFRLVDSPSNRHIVQVLSEDQGKLHTTLFAVPAQRMEPADEPEVRFLEAPANQPAAIHTWWYPGRSIGHEFIWPREQAVQVAKRTNSPVLTTGSDTVWGDGLPEDATLARVGPDGREMPVEGQTGEMRGPAVSGRMNAENAEATQTTPAPSAAQPATNPGAQAAAERDRDTAAPRISDRERETTTTTAATSASAQDRTSRAARTELPATASPLPLVGLIGIASLVASGLLRRK